MELNDGATNLAALLESHAETATNAGDFLTAEMLWVRALKIRDRLPDRAGRVHVLRSLAGMYGSWGRWHRALDAVFEVEMEFRREPRDPAGLAGALADIGTTMLGAARPDSAADYLKQAVTAYRQLAEPAPVDQAYALVSWGRALWTQDAWVAARRRFSAALALLVDVDDTLADQVRHLLRQPNGQPLPNTPSFTPLIGTLKGVS